MEAEGPQGQGSRSDGVQAQAKLTLEPHRKGREGVRHLAARGSRKTGLQVEVSARPSRMSRTRIALDITRKQKQQANPTAKATWHRSRRTHQVKRHSVTGWQPKRDGQPLVGAGGGAPREGPSARLLAE